ncbi:PhzF family phenazine biosynthesis protein [Pseudoalteromonas luteoviolacea]|uniref:PhzF family phenazine biosynthesis protein n=1 Tax=Pseudoalteromonas luteoviolacea TaxID=43657 RepID=UPI0011530515|nr:PhzF family phenazine biosynthesis protein [Pseudoalteromonas luteoviolacea]TQF67665.1 PhzF family phenazine biosynthesis protein [Pseudoalteromonas luteoviolacea]
MDLDIFVVDAFTDEQFKGNSAAVVPLEGWISDTLMQKIAAENNLSETAFIVKNSNNSYHIRWFSPLTEIDFCGHATLATAFVLFHHLNVESEVEFTTNEVGSLTVKLQGNGKIEMNFPLQQPEPVLEAPTQILEGLSITPNKVLKNRQAYFAVYESQSEVEQVNYQSDILKQLAPLDVVVTAQGDEVDFVSRYFWPANGGDEDPVTGSIHTGLAPYWAQQLNKSRLKAFQASERGGQLNCDVDFASNRVTILGEGVLYLKGQIFV